MPGMPWRNVHLHWRMNWWDFAGWRSRSPRPHICPILCSKAHWCLCEILWHSKLQIFPFKTKVHLITHQVADLQKCKLLYENCISTEILEHPINVCARKTFTHCRWCPQNIQITTHLFSEQECFTCLVYFYSEKRINNCQICFSVA